MFSTKQKPQSQKTNGPILFPKKNKNQTHEWAYPVFSKEKNNTQNWLILFSKKQKETNGLVIFPKYQMARLYLPKNKKQMQRITDPQTEVAASARRHRPPWDPRAHCFWKIKLR